MVRIMLGSGTTAPKHHLQGNGVAKNTHSSTHAVRNSYMQSGSLTIGVTNVNYGTGGYC